LKQTAGDAVTCFEAQVCSIWYHLKVTLPRIILHACLLPTSLVQVGWGDLGRNRWQH